MALADHLQAPRQHGLFNHHGIDLGDGTVAHYLEGRAILRSPLDEFSRGQPITVVDYPEEEISAPGVTVRRAMGRLGEQNYNLLFNNCEHFAHWCKTGRHRSSQVEDWLHTGSLGALAFGQFVPAALLTGVRMLLRQGITLEPGHLEKGRELALNTMVCGPNCKEGWRRNSPRPNCAGAATSNRVISSCSSGSPPRSWPISSARWRNWRQGWRECCSAGKPPKQPRLPSPCSRTTNPDPRDP